MSALDAFFDILASGADMIIEAGPVTVLLCVAGIMVIIFCLLAIFEDLEKILSDWLFWRWLGKNSNFTRFETEEEAREGYVRDCKKKLYDAKTKHMRKRLAKSGDGNPASQAENFKSGTFGEKIVRWRDNIDGFVEHVVDLWDGFSTKFRKGGEKPDA